MSDELKIWSAPDGWRPEPCQHSGELPYPCAGCSAYQKQQRLELVTRDRDTLRAQLDAVRRLLSVHKDRVETDDVLAAMAGTLPQPHCPGCDLPDDEPTRS